MSGNFAGRSGALQPYLTLAVLVPQASTHLGGSPCIASLYDRQITNLLLRGPQAAFGSIFLFYLPVFLIQSKLAAGVDNATANRALALLRAILIRAREKT